jgi:hypothetical protein
MIAIPFFIHQAGQSESDLVSARSSQSRITGLARFDGHALVLEWSERVQVSESGLTGSRTYEEDAGQGTCTIALEMLQAAELRGGWWRPQLEITTTTMAGIAHVSGVRAGRVELRIARPRPGTGAGSQLRDPTRPGRRGIARRRASRPGITPDRGEPRH